GGRVVVEPLPVMRGDPNQLRQLLGNLVGNALKYHRPDTPPVVKVYAQRFPDRVQIRVEDNGIGFDPSNAEQMFQPFQRLVGRSQYEGTGMGLAICRRIVERHGGTIAATSRPGEGSVFTVTLPVAGAVAPNG
ncbi:MAG TPA: ATP-binding protein, partial [Anaerolineaceae bacterium]|nr:ATP-binding protein [Anaerolineaceae bacterium]